MQWWRLAVVLAASGATGAWLLIARRLRRSRLAGLKPIADDLGLHFHGGSFRGRFRGHSVRGDGGNAIPRTDAPSGRSLLDLFAVGRRAVRVRVELTTPELSSPETATAAIAARSELKAVGADASLYETALRGTELAFVLREDAAAPATVRRVLERAIDAAKTERQHA